MHGHGSEEVATEADGDSKKGEAIFSLTLLRRVWHCLQDFVRNGAY